MSLVALHISVTVVHTCLHLSVSTQVSVSCSTLQFCTFYNTNLLPRVHNYIGKFSYDTLLFCNFYTNLPPAVSKYTVLCQLPRHVRKYTGKWLCTQHFHDFYTNLPPHVSKCADKCLLMALNFFVTFIHTCLQQRDPDCQSPSILSQSEHGK